MKNNYTKFWNISVLIGFFKRRLFIIPIVISTSLFTNCDKIKNSISPKDQGEQFILSLKPNEYQIVETSVWKFGFIGTMDGKLLPSTFEHNFSTNSIIADKITTYLNSKLVNILAKTNGVKFSNYDEIVAYYKKNPNDLKVTFEIVGFWMIGKTTQSNISFDTFNTLKSDKIIDFLKDYSNASGAKFIVSESWTWAYNYSSSITSDLTMGYAVEENFPNLGWFRVGSLITINFTVDGSIEICLNLEKKEILATIKSK